MFWTERRLIVAIAVIVVLTALGVTCSIFITPGHPAMATGHAVPGQD
jgi:hypothetical protein